MGIQVLVFSLTGNKYLHSTMLRAFSFLCMVGLILGISDPDSEYEYGVFGSQDRENVYGLLGSPRHLVPRIIQEECKVESITIEVTNCRVEYDEACTTEEKVVGDKVTYDEVCEEREVEECKPVHYVPRSRLVAFVNLPTQPETECKKVIRNICKDVPKKEEVIKEVEVCVSTPKETCEAGRQLASKTTCEKVKH
eukprot:TRINITY_DN3167_c0_g1_i4.p1 TRINITY_DN3167_c0_g1~~TRINITY_DN3167_c0_g1_i4.p1  ORF type:complete len:202 (+),score=63.90 TRINITY_DN3167_c0_g1_i4:23-607(+)